MQQINSFPPIDHGKLCQDVHEHVLGKLVRGHRISYGDPEYPGETVREYPDGRRVILHITLPHGTTRGDITEGREIPPRDRMCPDHLEKEFTHHHCTCYLDPEYPGVLVREYRDGRRIILHVPPTEDGHITEGREIPPRKDRVCPTLSAAHA